MKIICSRFGAVVIFVGIILFVSTETKAVGTLICISSVTYNGSGNGDDYAKGISCSWSNT